MNDRLDKIGDQIREFLDEKNAARDRALQGSRTLIRHCSKAIRAVHRDERELAKEHLDQAGEIVASLRKELSGYPDLHHAGYTQSSLKEFAEAHIFNAIVGDEPVPHPDDLGVDYAAYLGGLGEAAGELRRRVLDIIRHDELARADHLLEAMDDIYGLLVTIDFPDAITGKLRRITDMVRGVTERTRGDLTTTRRQNELKRALEAVEKKLDQAGK